VSVRGELEVMPSILLSPALLSTEERPSREEQAAAALEAWEAKMVVMAANHASDSILATAAAFDPDEEESKARFEIPRVSKQHFAIPFVDAFEPASMAAILTAVYS